MEDRLGALLDSPDLPPQSCQIHTYTLAREHWRAIHDARTTAGGDDVANRRNTAQGASRGTKHDGRQMSFVVRDAEPSNEPAKLALHIPPPRSPVSAVRRLDLAARFAMELGDLAAELVTEGKLGQVERHRTARTKEPTR
jgi:hypothetical protein